MVAGNLSANARVKVWRFANGRVETWLSAYVLARREWLAANSNTALQKCVYRKDELTKLLRAENWGFELPFAIRGVAIDSSVLSGRSTHIPAESPEEPLLLLEHSMLTGEDIKALQCFAEKGFIS
jgi:hypothetical protein